MVIKIPDSVREKLRIREEKRAREKVIACLPSLRVLCVVTSQTGLTGWFGVGK
jgi:hypothetical protein